MVVVHFSFLVVAIVIRRNRMSEVPGEHQAENPASSDPSVENLHQLIQSVVRRAMEAERSRLSAAPGSAQTSGHLGSG